MPERCEVSKHREGLIHIALNKLVDTSSDEMLEWFKNEEDIVLANHALAAG